MPPRYRMFLRTVSVTLSEYARRELLTIGGYKPDSTSTGLLNDSTRPMSTVNGDVTMTSGQVITDTIINGAVIMNGTNQVLDNCWIRGTGAAPASERGLINTGSATVNATIRDCLIEPQVPDYRWNGITGHHFTAKRVRTRNTTDGFGVFNTASPGTDVAVNILGCWVENLAKFYPDGGIHSDGTHNDAIQLQGGANIVVRGCVLSSYISTEAGNTGGVNVSTGAAGFTPTNTAGNASIQLNRNIGELSNLTIVNNWVYGGQIGINGTAITTALTLGTFTGNRFDHGQYLDVSQQGSNNTQTIRIHPTPTCTISDNLYEDNGVAVNVRRAT